MCEQTSKIGCPVGCDECPHETWIRRWIEREERETLKERRRHELLHAVKANVISWALIGVLGYAVLLLWDGVSRRLGAGS